MAERSTISTPISYKANIKRITVNALRNVFDADYPDKTNILPSIFVSVEWPDKPEQYPCLIVSYQEKSLNNAGIGHFEHLAGGPNVYKRWLYSGSVQVLIIAETSLQRDYISDHLVHLLAFSSTDLNTALFTPFIETNLGVDIQILKDTLVPYGESTEKGSDWGLIDQTLYMTGYSFDIAGSFSSGVVRNAYIRGVNEAAEII